MIKIIHIVSVITFVLAFALLFAVGFWLLYPYKPLVLKDLPLPIEPKVAESGGEIIMTIDYCKYMNLPTVVSERFIDELVYARPTFITNNPTGCHISKAIIPVPHGLTPNEKYYIEVTFTYQVNPIRKIEVKAQSETFTVTD